MHSSLHLQFNFDMNPELFSDGANRVVVNEGMYFSFSTSNGQLASSVPAGMFINDVAVDPDTGDAYFTDSFNCREPLQVFGMRVGPSPYVCCSGIMKVKMGSEGLRDATTSTWYSYRTNLMIVNVLVMVSHVNVSGFSPQFLVTFVRLAMVNSSIRHLHHSEAFSMGMVFLFSRIRQAEAKQSLLCFLQ
jgi:hypothetical protein